MLAVLVSAAAALTFPAEASFGVWSGKDHVLEMSAPTFAVSEYTGTTINVRQCAFSDQIGSETKYAAHCDDGEDYTVNFLDPTTLEFDGIRFTFGD